MLKMTCWVKVIFLQNFTAFPCPRLCFALNKKLMSLHLNKFQSLTCTEILLLVAFQWQKWTSLVDMVSVIGFQAVLCLHRAFWSERGKGWALRRKSTWSPATTKYPSHNKIMEETVQTLTLSSGFLRNSSIQFWIKSMKYWKLMKVNGAFWTDLFPSIFKTGKL